MIHIKLQNQPTPEEIKKTLQEIREKQTRAAFEAIRGRTAAEFEKELRDLDYAEAIYQETGKWE